MRSRRTKERLRINKPIVLLIAQLILLTYIIITIPPANLIIILFVTLLISTSVYTTVQLYTDKTLSSLVAFFIGSSILLRVLNILDILNLVILIALTITLAILIYKK